jgi:hypothetical protein
LEALLVVVAPPQPAGVGVAPPCSVGFSMAPLGAGGFFFVDAKEARVLAAGGDMVNIKRSNIRVAPEVKTKIEGVEGCMEATRPPTTGIKLVINHAIDPSRRRGKKFVERAL